MENGVEKFTYLKYDYSSNNDTVISFLNNNLGHSVTDISFKWEYYFDCSNTVFTVATNNEIEIIATQTFLPIPILYAGKQILTHKSENSFLTAANRGKGVFENLYHFGVKECNHLSTHFIWGFTALLSMWQKKLHFETNDSLMHEGIYFSGFISPSFIDKKYNGLFSKKLKACLIYGCAPLFTFLKSWFIKIPKSIEIETALKNEADLLDFITKKHKDEVCLYYDKDFINWRVNNNPILKYQYYYFYNGSQLIGYILLNQQEEIMHLVELNMTDKEDYKWAIKFLSSICSTKNIRQLKFWGNALHPDIAYTFKLLSTYFIGKQEVNKIMGWVFKNNLISQKIAYNKWYITPLWTEGFKW